MKKRFRNVTGSQIRDPEGHLRDPGGYLRDPGRSFFNRAVISDRNMGDTDQDMGDTYYLQI